MKKNTKIFGALALVSGLIVAGGCSLGGGASSDKFYTVTFVQEGYADVVRTVKEGTALTDIPETQAKEGYTVVWGDIDVSNVTKDLTITAVATPNEYLITYQIAESDGETMEGELTQTVTYDATYELATPEKENYEFLGWKSNSQIVAQTGTWKIANDVTLTAAWKNACYTIVFVQTDGTQVVRLVDIGSTIPAEDVPELITVPGYDVEWSVTDFSTITDNATVTAVKTAKNYTVSYNLTEGEEMEDATADTFAYNTAYELKVPTKEGYTFQNWKNAEGAAVPLTGTWNYLSNLELTAEWTADDNTITFIYTNGDKVEKTVQTGGALTDIPALEPVEGYDVAWSVTDFTNITGAVIVNEVRTPKSYTITFKVTEDSTIDGTTQKVVFNSEYTLPTPTRENYNFVGWEKPEGGIVTDEKWSIASDITLTARWVEDFYTVTFVYENGDSITRTVKKDAALTDIPAPTQKKGYTSVWNVTDFSKIEGNMKVDETVTANKYVITFDGNGFTMESATMEVTYDDNFTLPTLTRNGYTFGGWYDENGNKVESGTWTTDSNVTLKAKWTQNNDGWTNNY